MRSDVRFLVDLSRFKKNLDRLSEKNSAEILFMVKANAYGHGLLEMTRAAYEYGVKNFGVASLMEALTLRRELAPNLLADIYVFSETNFSHPNLIKHYAEYRIIPVISSLENLQIFLSEDCFKSVPLCLKFNTGMNRLGIDKTDLNKVITLLQTQKRSIDHLMTHFGCSYYLKKDGDKTQKQIEEFEEIKKTIRSSGVEVHKISLSNSGALEQNLDLEQTHIRPGLMLYGPQSTMTKELIWDGEIISRLEIDIISKKEVTKGTPIGYGATPAPEAGTVVFLPMGYGDGFLTYYSKAKFSFDNHIGKVVGRVNMDITAVLFPNISNNDLKNLKMLEFWDHSQQRMLELSQDLGTIPYQIFCAASSRVPRHYI